MSYLLDVKEILEFAVYIEERGYEFYVGAMKKFGEPRATELFQYLADEEFKHEKVFKKLMEQERRDQGGEPRRRVPGLHEGIRQGPLTGRQRGDPLPSWPGVRPWMRSWTWPWALKRTRSSSFPS